MPYTITIVFIVILLLALMAPTTVLGDFSGRLPLPNVPLCRRRYSWGLSCNMVLYTYIGQATNRVEEKRIAQV